MKPKIFKSMLIFFLSVCFFINSATYAYPKEDEFSQWLNSTPLGRKAISYITALYSLDTKYYKELTPEQLEAIKKIQDEALLLISSKLDKHSAYINAERFGDFKDRLSSGFEGIGVQTTVPGLKRLNEEFGEIIRNSVPDPKLLEDRGFRIILVEYLSKTKPGFSDLYQRITNPLVPSEGLLIEKILPGQPAEKAGMKNKEGWHIVRVNNEKIESMPFEDAVKLIRGPKGTKVKITIVPPLSEKGSPEQTIEIERGFVGTSLIEIKLTAPQIGYLKIHNFYHGADKDFEAAVENLKSLGMEKLILDLRGNPGGYMDAADKILEVILPAGRVGSFAEFRGGVSDVILSPPENKVPKIFKGKIIVLIDGNSASASELVASALKEQGSAVVIGEKSYGKGTIQTSIPFLDGSALHLTIGRYLSPVTGECVDGKGVIPDIKITDDPATATDEVVEKAIEVLSGS